ncbi:hypothetical protein MBCUT_19470 [Methanobrevibacter cuticularis]|uniref:Uncharacterized protein n=2 Tax=Methanobrevibacter cuticularis TaxID=47311 RepID=A0A166CQ76_9EURY|nr:hypothetical protein MBCUT_19470 [Methanobrevibacter cuticularis]
MILLDNFDKNIDFNYPNKDYFVKLKNLKWNKEAKKLLNKIDKIYGKYASTCTDEVFDENPDDGYPILFGIFLSMSWKSLILLTGCSAVNDGRDVMGFDDVVCAFQTYFKLLDLINND